MTRSSDGCSAFILTTFLLVPCLAFGFVFWTAFSLGRAWHRVPSVKVELVPAASVDSSR